MDKSKIEWTDATWNVIRGCEKVSPGCAYCYAETLVNGRLRGDFGTLQVAEDRLDQPIRWRRHRRIFVNSLSDLFWDQVPDYLVDRHFAVMALAPQHQFQILTKRPDRMRAYLANPERQMHVADAILSVAAPTVKEPIRMVTAMTVWRGLTLTADPPKPRWPLPNVWLGTSTENQTMVDKRIQDLQATPAAFRFLSIEPLLGPMDLTPWIGGGVFAPQKPTVDWVIVGGESGAKARPMNPEWVRRLRDQCVAAAVPFFFKQWGEWAPAAQVGERIDPDRLFPVHNWHSLQDTASLRLGKKLAGRTLDGRLWDEVPKGR